MRNVFKNMMTITLIILMKISFINLWKSGGCVVPSGPDHRMTHSGFRMQSSICPQVKFIQVVHMLRSSWCRTRAFSVAHLGGPKWAKWGIVFLVIWLRSREINAGQRSHPYDRLRIKRRMKWWLSFDSAWIYSHCNRDTHFTHFGPPRCTTKGTSLQPRIDLQHVYHLVWISPGDKWKTGILNPLWFIRVVVMPEGLTNAPTAFKDLWMRSS